MTNIDTAALSGSVFLMVLGFAFWLTGYIAQSVVKKKIENCTASVQATVGTSRVRYVKNSRGSSKQYLPELTFEVGRSIVTAESALYTPAFREEGTRVAVRYNPSNPVECYIEEDAVQAGFTSLVLRGVGKVIMALCAIACILAIAGVL